jgi:hypothetical protein
MKTKAKATRPLGGVREVVRKVVDDWADGEAMLQGLGGIDPDYDETDDAVPPELRAQWQPSRFEGE